jgi:hypothetical protein
VAAAADSVVCDGQVEDQAPAARRILEEATDLHVAAPLACACCDAVLCAEDVSALCVCVFITAGPSTKLFTWRGGGYGRTCATRDDESSIDMYNNDVGQKSAITL